MQRISGIHIPYYAYSPLQFGFWGTEYVEYLTSKSTLVEAKTTGYCILVKTYRFGQLYQSLLA